MATSLFHNSQAVRGFLLTPVTMPFCRHSAKQNAIFFNQEHIYHKDKWRLEVAKQIKSPFSV